MAEQQIKFEITANSVAWYGAFVATASAIVSFYNAYKDRARIKITYNRDIVIVGPQAIYSKDKTYFNVTVINKGRRPIKITNVGLRCLGRKKKYALFSDSFATHRNKIITEEDPRTEFMMEQDEELLLSAWYIVVYDGTGRKYTKYMKYFPIKLFYRIVINAFKASG